MSEIFSPTTLTVNQLIEKIDTGELGLPELQRPFELKRELRIDEFQKLDDNYTKYSKPCSFTKTGLA